MQNSQTVTVCIFLQRAGLRKHSPRALSAIEQTYVSKPKGSQKNRLWFYYWMSFHVITVMYITQFSGYTRQFGVTVSIICGIINIFIFLFIKLEVINLATKTDTYDKSSNLTPACKLTN